MLRLADTPCSILPFVGPRPHSSGSCGEDGLEEGVLQRPHEGSGSANVCISASGVY